MQVLNAAKGLKRPADQVQAEPKKRDRAKGQAKGKAKAKAKASAGSKEKGEEGEKNEKVEGGMDELVEEGGESVLEGEKEGEESVKGGMDESMEKGKGSEKKGEDGPDVGEKGEEEDLPAGAKRIRQPKAKVTPEMLEAAWKEKVGYCFKHKQHHCCYSRQEPILKAAGIPIPDDYTPKTKSFTLAAPTEEGHNVQILLDAQLRLITKKVSIR